MKKVFVFLSLFFVAYLVYPEEVGLSLNPPFFSWNDSYEIVFRSERFNPKNIKSTATSIEVITPDVTVNGCKIDSLIYSFRENRIKSVTLVF